MKKAVPIHTTYNMLKKAWFNVSLIVCFSVAIGLLMILDYFNLESFNLFNDGGFYFYHTWKGRMFYLFFLWLFIIESVLNWKKLSLKSLETGVSLFKVIAIFTFAIIPLIYIISVNFLGLDQTIIRGGEALRGDYWRTYFTDWKLILEGFWPLSFEYLVLTISFISAIVLAYEKEGLEIFSITIALIGGISIINMIDTIYPYGVFKPLQLVALPTAACAAALLEILGFNFSLSFLSGPTSMPVIRIYGDFQGSIAIAWPCAGVHSLFLYTLIILLLFKKSKISIFRKTIYFIIGAIGTYTVNVLRIVQFFIIFNNAGPSVAYVFHDVYGELFFIVWIFLYILLISCIQKFKLGEKLIDGVHNFLESWKRNNF